MRRAVGAVMAVLLAVVVAGCAVQIPSDPRGTLDRVTGGILRVGASPSGALVRVDAGAAPGPLADLVEGFARERGAELDWTVGSEEDLVDGLEEGTLDVAIGGMTDATPWSDRVSVTRFYTGIAGAGERAVVLLLPLGENALQSALEAFLDEEVGP